MAIYLDIAQQLKNEIHHQYESGDLLPAEQKLASRFNVNRHTVRRAIDELVQDGLVKRFQGLGNQVTRPAIDYSLNNQSCFTYNLSKAGLTLDTQVLECCEYKLPQELALRLKLSTKQEVLLIKTCRSINKQATTLIKHHLFGVDKEIMSQYQSGSLHGFLKTHYHFHATRGTTRLKARMPTFDECQQLQIGRGVPVMEIHSQYYLIESGKLMEYSISISRSDIFEYSVEP
ncbi:phosphonate metabolism transcriptional regulator PhnF [Marinomonas spartinae]|uniref:phosphonate metabolism transcriptional regulator PhnF n=1 Tax=Marinomonas spartinae TaxID=1792290 RepID=UPI0018F12FEF|nr:phosphonate metabolism transcriptional regulator PhnF [Marinomonas spartinae]MBJ7554099.1 phosphonate metabolism transcriptional regulator PhnF [Marinomonas spartinae]